MKKEKANWVYNQPKFEFGKEISIPESPWGGHSFFAYDLVYNLKPKTIVELGTYKGNSLFSFAQAVKDYNLNTHLYGIDTWEGDEHSGYYGEEIYNLFKKIKNSKYSNLDITCYKMFFDEALNNFKDNSIDFLHIDGVHTYEAVLHDFNKWLPKVKQKSGIILLHDITETKKNFGVYKLWEELKTQYKNTLSFTHSHGLGVIFLDNNLLSPSNELSKIWPNYYRLLSENSSLEDTCKELEVEQRKQSEDLMKLKLLNNRNRKELELIRRRKIWRVLSIMNHFKKKSRNHIDLYSQVKKQSLNFQVILYFSSKDLELFFNSLKTIEITNSSLNIIFADQSENQKEFKKINSIIEKHIKTIPQGINIQIVQQPNYGFGRGHNEIYRNNYNTYQDYFLILNPDIIFHPDFITNINTYLHQLEKINWGILELEQFPSEHPKYFNPKTLETNWASGAGMIIKREYFENIGMFDENIFMYGEDVDLSIRMRMNGYKVLHLPNAKFTHRTKDTDVSEETEFTRVNKQAAELYIRYKFAKDKDVKHYKELISTTDSNRETILNKFDEMKDKLKEKNYYKDFLNSETQDYTNFRWTL